MKYLFLVALNICIFLGCSPKQNADNESVKNTNVSVDSSFNAFLSNFKVVQLPYSQDSIQPPAADKKTFIKDYFLRNFLKNDKISNVDCYMVEYANTMQDENPWNFAWYGVQFPVNKEITAIIYHTYKQISASNGGTYQSMLATFDNNRQMIDCKEVAEQTIYQSSNLITNEKEEYATFSSVYATTKTKYQIDKSMIISISQTKIEEVYQEIQDTKDSTLLAKNQDSTFTKQIKSPVVEKKELKILANGKIGQ